MNVNEVSGLIVDAAIAVHRELGPGMLESTYEACLAHELGLRGLRVVRQIELPVVYKDLRVDQAYRMDMVVADSVVVEVKAVEKLLPVHEAQLLTYLKLSHHQVGLILNFNVPLLKNGILRMANHAAD